MRPDILVVEDDKAVRNLILNTLSAFGYSFHFAADGASALKDAVSSQPRLYILDLGLPDMDGVEIIKKLRSWTNNPIIVVSARTEVADRITALDLGADDYLTKPFSVDELLARIRVAIRKMQYDHAHPEEELLFESGDLRIDYAAERVFVDGEEIHLTPMEYRLLRLLSKNADKVLTHSYILQSLWANPLENDTQSLRVFMASLRKKIEKDPSAPRHLHTHVGVGYRLMRI